MNIVEMNFELVKELENSLKTAIRYNNGDMMYKIVTRYLDKYKDHYSYDTIIHYIYWCTKFKITTLNRILGYTGDNRTYLIDQGLIEKQIYKSKCNICGKNQKIEVSSRRELGDLKRNPKTYICNECELDIDACSNFYYEYSKNKNLKRKEINENFYNDYLRSEHWKKVRSEALTASDNKCLLCSSKQDLNVHHKTHATIRKESLNDLIVLCDTCHRKHHFG